MFKNFTVTDKIMFVSALLSLIFSEVLYFQGEKQDATFLGLWVPSILAFGIYLKLINNTKNDWFNPILRGADHHFIQYWVLFCYQTAQDK